MIRPKPTSAEPPITWLAKLPHELSEAECQAIVSPDPAPLTHATRGRGTSPILCAIGGWALFLIGIAIIWLLASIHTATLRACPTMAAECQVAQESPQ